MAGLRYEYQPLEEGKIRCLHIIGCRDNGELEIRLEDLVLKDADNTYTAVSHTWGSPDTVHRIWVDGRYLTVQDNAWRFLRHCWKVRSLASDSPQHLGQVITDRLWLDSICINQDGNVEKSHQVARMGQIYSRARQVFVWLDRTSPQSVIGHEMAQLAEQCDSPVLLLKRLFEETTPRLNPEKVQVRRAIIREAYELISHPYWTRLWIVQETQLAQRTLIILDSYCFELSQIHMIPNYMPSIEAEYLARQRLHNPVPTTRSPCATGMSSDHGLLMTDCATFLRLTSSKGLPQVRTLEEVLEAFRHQCCLDKRDVFYGLVTMSRWANKINVDYSLSVEEVLSQCLMLLQKERLSSEYEKKYSVSVALEVRRAMDVTSKSVFGRIRSLPTERAAVLLSRSFRLDLKRKAFSTYLPSWPYGNKWETIAFGPRKDLMESLNTTTGVNVSGDASHGPQKSACYIPPDAMIVLRHNVNGTTSFHQFVFLDSKTHQIWTSTPSWTFAASIEMQLNHKDVDWDTVWKDPSRDIQLFCSLTELLWISEKPR